MNQIILIGNLTADPEARNTQNGIAVTQFTVAVQRKFKNDQGRYDADFIRCVAWRQTAEFLAKYGGKGRKIAVVGELQSRTYDKDGQKHTVFEVIANNVELLDKRDAQPEPGEAPKQTFTEVDETDDLPF